MKERNAYVKCPVCGAETNLTGVDIGGRELIPLNIHVKGQFPDANDDHDNMLLAESLSDPQTCSASEKLVRVVRPGETETEWYDRHPSCRPWVA